MWCLMRMLPLLIGEFVPKGDEYWQMFISLMDIVDIVCAPVISRGDIYFLNLCVADFLERYVAIDYLHVKSKAHYLIHYASQI